ncbi:MAG TPA: response regulator [Candidatus Acidoferrum sp.]|nr:response regulator [Candidatus Acidoferrum sp.]
MRLEEPKAPFVLIAEDNADDRLLLNYAFRSARLPNPYLIVNDGAEAIDWMQKRLNERLAEAHPLDLLIVDIQMPNKTGVEVLEWVRSQPIYRELPVVVMSGLRSPAMIDRVMTLGAHSYLFKPGDYGELTNFIAEFNALRSLNVSL